MNTEIKVCDVVRLRKPHPCGSCEWEVVRTGAGVGLKCLKCQRRVLLERSIFEKRLKQSHPKAISCLIESVIYPLGRVLLPRADCDKNAVLRISIPTRIGLK